MTMLSAECPKCGKMATNYFHKVDYFNMSMPLDPGVYNMICAETYGSIPRPECGHRFKVKLSVVEKVEVVS